MMNISKILSGEVFTIEGNREDLTSNDCIINMHLLHPLIYIFYENLSKLLIIVKCNNIR